MKYIALSIILLSLVTAFISESLMHFSMTLGISVRLSFWTPFALLAVLLICLIYTFTKLNGKVLYKVISAIALSSICLGLNFYLQPFYPEDFENRYQSVKYTEEEKEELEAISDKKIKCIFLATCPFCEIAAEKLNILYNNGSVSDIEFIYFAHPKTADSIVTSQNLNSPYTTFKDKKIFKLVNGSFPAVIVSNGDSSKLWTGNDVNFACMDYLRSVK